LRAAPNVRFAGDRRATEGYLPPCALPARFAEDPAPWADVLDRARVRNATLPACTPCALAARCSFRDAGALAGAVTPIPRPPGAAPPPARRSSVNAPVRCTAPWTTMMQLDPGGEVTQCCPDWSPGSRGDRRRRTFMEIWNDEPYRAARRAMKHGPIESLCDAVCPRLYDGQLAEGRTPPPTHGSEAFRRNQALLAADLAEGREEVRCRPTTLGLAASTYCNYDCIMCDHGRTPRRDLPDDVWDELPRFMPTLQTLVLSGGEPLASPRVMRFLREFDQERWPDVGVSLTTNGSLLTEAVLRQLERCTFADVSVSLNAGTAEAYEQVERGLPLEVVLQNLDALVAYRARRRRPFQLRTSFVVQPANAHTLVDFGELTAARGIGVRLLPLTVARGSALDFYADPDAVARVLEHLDRFAAWAAAVRPGWSAEIGAVRSAIENTHRGAAAQRGQSPPVVAG
jgi:sulfatase maturation enzyme AslB (radical SAM superfamily)